MVTTDCTIRRAGPGDASVIGRHRVGMFRDMGEVPTESLADELLERSIAMLGPLIAEGRYVGWLAIDHAGRVIAGAGVHVKDQLPRMSLDHATIVTAPLPLVVNVYTEPDWRGRGVARALMIRVMEWARIEGVDRLVLHASAAGRHLYESLGFVATNEMRWSVGTKAKSKPASR